MSIALDKLKTIQKETGNIISIGLEPSPDYLFHGLTASMTGYKAFLRTIINATCDRACAYKFNLAFFEALPGGWDLMFEVRELIPSRCLVIADAKRSDIGTTAQRYASMLYDQLKADAATVNPLMGYDSVKPFLEYRDKLTFLLCLTSNPGADDFLLPNDLYKEIARKANDWSELNNVGLVVGATRPQYLREIREIAPKLPFLIPGIGAQGGNLEETLENAKMEGDFSGVIVHVTRGILPKDEKDQEPRDVIREKLVTLEQQIDQLISK